MADWQINSLLHALHNIAYTLGVATLLLSVITIVKVFGERE